MQRVPQCLHDALSWTQLGSGLPGALGLVRLAEAAVFGFGGSDRLCASPGPQGAGHQLITSPWPGEPGLLPARSSARPKQVCVPSVAPAHPDPGSLGRGLRDRSGKIRLYELGPPAGSERLRTPPTG
ncbi:hypothetical protein P7K49_020704 [Saguinus oedipus]|uniref:Uncharacterized protein n=1 Tax=Saguinus oedipus TaxID=9490 RepID=A0ABQ9V121_SAGOE|nr:hypothetical protein P7K49_020704 [Saguinus oedipus]